MGLRLRLRANYPVSGFPYQARVVLKALKRYGMIVADNGTSWYLTGAPDPGWAPADMGAPASFKPGIFVFRTLADCDRMLRYVNRVRRAAVIGGGLLGLEAARGCAGHG